MQSKVLRLVVNILNTYCYQHTCDCHKPLSLILSDSRPVCPLSPLQLLLAALHNCCHQSVDSDQIKSERKKERKKEINQKLTKGCRTPTRAHNNNNSIHRSIYTEWLFIYWNLSYQCIRYRTGLQHRRGRGILYTPLIKGHLCPYCTMNFKCKMF